MKQLFSYQREIEAHLSDHWEVPFKQFVDDFRRERDLSAVAAPGTDHNPRVAALLASTIEYLCREQQLDTPAWTWDVPALEHPWFVSGFESLKAIAIAESPVQFRRRLIFVLRNFLERV